MTKVALRQFSVINAVFPLFFLREFGAAEGHVSPRWLSWLVCYQCSNLPEMRASWPWPQALLWCCRPTCTHMQYGNMQLLGWGEWAHSSHLLHSWTVSYQWGSALDYHTNLWVQNRLWLLCITIGSGNRLLPDGNKPLPEPMLLLTITDISFLCIQPRI